MKRSISILAAASTALILSNCAVTPDGQTVYRQTGATQGAGLGAAGGALLGAIIGHQSGEWEKGALVGAAIGGLGGYAIGNEQDKAYGQGSAPSPYRRPAPTPYQPYGYPK